MISSFFKVREPEWKVNRGFGATGSRTQTLGAGNKQNKFNIWGNKTKLRFDINNRFVFILKIFF